MEDKSDMRTRLTLSLQQEERDALRQFADTERREMRDQAALIIRRALESAGYLVNSHNRVNEDASGYQGLHGSLENVRGNAQR